MSYSVSIGHKNQPIAVQYTHVHRYWKRALKGFFSAHVIIELNLRQLCVPGGQEA